MTYDETKARTIQKRYGLSDTTLRVWKTRGAIPDKYAGEVDTSNTVKGGLQKRVIDALTDPRINTKQVTSVDYQKIFDVRRGGSSLTENQVKEIRREITALRNLLRRFTQGGSEAILKEIINHPLLHPYVIFRDEKKMCDRVRKGLSAYEDEIERARVIVVQLYSDLKF